MIRKLSIGWGPSPSLRALAALAAPGRRARGPALVHDALRRELREAMAAIEPALAACAAFVACLEARGVVRAQGAAPGGERAVREGELSVDLARLEATAADEARGVDGRAHCTLFALRGLLRALANESLFTIGAVKAGSRRVGFEVALKEVERVAKRQGLRASVVPARFATKTPDPEPPPSAPAAAATEASTPKGAKARRARTRRAKDEGFGGLPDDAESAAPPEEPAREPDRPGRDAEFFLREAALAWPCARDALDRARRAVISKLHPDRAGDASAGDFHRAIKGHLELTRLLERLPSADAPPPAEERAQPDATRPRAARRAQRGATHVPVAQGDVQEWPPRPAPPPEPPRPRDDDAEFFLREAALSWPCDAATLRGAWASLSARLRRMTPASVAAASHARASRGFELLMRAMREAA